MATGLVMLLTALVIGGAAVALWLPAWLSVRRSERRRWPDVPPPDVPTFRRWPDDPK